MATQVINITLTDSSWTGSILVDPELIQNNVEAYLRTFQVITTFVILQLSSTPSGLSSSSGPDFSSILETYDGALTFIHPSVGTVVLKGPNHSDNSLQDFREPYTWSPDNVDELIQWLSDVNDASSQSITLTLNDGITVDGNWSSLVITPTQDGEWSPVIISSTQSSEWSSIIATPTRDGIWSPIIALPTEDSNWSEIIVTPTQNSTWSLLIVTPTRDSIWSNLLRLNPNKIYLARPMLSNLESRGIDGRVLGNYQIDVSWDAHFGHKDLFQGRIRWVTRNDGLSNPEINMEEVFNWDPIIPGIIRMEGDFQYQDTLINNPPQDISGMVEVPDQEVSGILSNAALWVTARLEIDEIL